MKRNVIIGMLLVVFLLLTACFAGTRNETYDTPAGFFTGVWHGWIAPIALILSLFTEYRIYEVYNNGFWYELGFYMAIISGFGGLSIVRKKEKKKK